MTADASTGPHRRPGSAQRRRAARTGSAQRVQVANLVHPGLRVRGTLICPRPVAPPVGCSIEPIRFGCELVDFLRRARFLGSG